MWGEPGKKGVTVAQTQTPSLVHAEFDHLCESLEEFETLPSYPNPEFGAERPEDEREEIALDEMILKGLVLPV